MAVYVDPSVWPYGRMICCHCWADTLQELLDMMTLVGVDHKWLQQPPKASWVHFDISKSKRVQVIANGGLERDSYSAVLFANRQRGNFRLHATVFNIRQQRLYDRRKPTT